MGYVLPNFNLSANVWRVMGVGGAYALPTAVYPCNLSPGKRVMVGLVGTGTSLGEIFMELLLPKGLDIRANWNLLLADLVECPVGSLRFYQVINVDDIGRGFANEHRIAWMSYLKQGALNFIPPIPAPVPLP